MLYLQEITSSQSSDSNSYSYGVSLHSYRPNRSPIHLRPNKTFITLVTKCHLICTQLTAPHQTIHLAPSSYRIHQTSSDSIISVTFHRLTLSWLPITILTLTSSPTFNNRYIFCFTNPNRSNSIIRCKNSRNDKNTARTACWKHCCYKNIYGYLLLQGILLFTRGCVKIIITKQFSINFSASSSNSNMYYVTYLAALSLGCQFITCTLSDPIKSRKSLMRD